MVEYKLTDFLPTTRKEMELRGWDEADVILFTGDAYVDHPSYGIAVIGRVLEAEGLRVAIVPQPDWHGDLRDFKKLGKPRLFFGVTAGNMDSMVNRYTARKRLRNDDAYSPDARPAMRPDYATVVYSKILKQLYPDTPIILGGIEASMRRLAHYDYWSDSLRPGILADSGADVLAYGMGEEVMRELSRRIAAGNTQWDEVPQIAYRRETSPDAASAVASPQHANDITLHSYETCLSDKRKQAENFRHIEQESNKASCARLWQKTGQHYVVVNPPYPLPTTAELDRVYDLPFTRLPHPKYKDKRIPAYEMIRHSITLHRGCFGGCAFCTISAHQGKFITSRSKESILREAKRITQMHDFKGYISDLGGPSANMYRIGGTEKNKCAKCPRPSCLHPKVCANLHIDYRPLLDIYRAVDALPQVKKSFVSSGVRYDMLANEAYDTELITKHVSGRLKVAPEHTSNTVLNLMRKPSFALFETFKERFERINLRHGLKQQLIPYFISSHPACTEHDMKQLATHVKRLHIYPEQVQDFTPTPMTLATEIYYTGLNPYTMQPVFTARTDGEKSRQHQHFFWYNPAPAKHPAANSARTQSAPQKGYWKGKEKSRKGGTNNKTR